MKARRAPVSETRAEPEDRTESGDPEARDSRATTFERGGHRPSRAARVAAGDVDGPVSHGRGGHPEGCECTRCRGFPQGHTLSTRHGAYAVVSLAPRAAEVAERIREVVPARSPADEIAIEGLAIVTVRIERAHAALTQVDDAVENPLGSYVGERAETVERLRTDLRHWLALSLRYCEQLALTPTARARLGLDVARTESALEEYVERTSGAGGAHA